MHALGRLLFDSGTQALLLHRMAHFFLNCRVPVIPLMIRRMNVFLTGADIFPAARIRRDVRFIHSVGIVIGERVIIENGCHIYGGVVLGGRGGSDDDGGQPHIGPETTICVGAKVLGNIKIGSRATIAAGAVVLSSLPDHALAAGVPAVVKQTYGVV